MSDAWNLVESESKLDDACGKPSFQEGPCGKPSGVLTSSSELLGGPCGCDVIDDRKSRGVEVLDPADLLEPELTRDQLETLKAKEYLVQSKDLAMFDALPLTSAQKANMLSKLCKLVLDEKTV